MDHPTSSRGVSRLMRLEIGKGNSLPIPIDIIIIIFSKLDLKSIAICRCVCKLWGYILRRSDFTEFFMSMSCSRGPNLLFAFSNESKLIFSSPHPQNPVWKSSWVVINHQMKFPFSFYGKCESSDYVNGLMCVKDKRELNGKEEIVLTICNPSTGQALILPKLETSIYYLWSFLGYDPIDKQFKVLAVTESGRHDFMCDEYQVLTLGSGSFSWRRIGYFTPHGPPFEKICINGVLYFTSFDRYTRTLEIVCFDVRFEMFSSIKVIGTLNETVLFGKINLINYNGKLGMLQFYERHRRYIFFDGISLRFKLWVLEDLKKDEWSEHAFVFSTVPENLVQKFKFEFVGVTKKMDIVLLGSGNSPWYDVFYLDLERNTIETVTVKIPGMEVYKSHLFRVLLDHVENVNLYPSV